MYDNVAKVRVAQNESEVNEAYELFYRSFGANYFEAKETFDTSRRLDESLKTENVFFIKDDYDNKLVAAARTVTRKLIIHNQEFEIGGIATTAVHPKYRGVGLFNKLTDTILFEMRQRRLSMCLVFARRAIDNIYVKHGFWGTPVERNLIPLNPPYYRSKEYRFRRIESLDTIPFLEKAYNHVYGSLAISLNRTQKLWQRKLLEGGSKPRFLGYMCVNLSNQDVGYIFTENNKIIEAAAISDDPNIYKIMFFSDNSPVEGRAPNNISLPLDHPAMVGLMQRSHSIYTRHPTIGGNVIRIVDPYNMDSRIMKFVRERLDMKGVEFTVKHNKIQNPNYARIVTAGLFGYELPGSRNILNVYKDGLWDLLKPDDILFSGMDDF